MFQPLNSRKPPFYLRRAARPSRWSHQVGISVEPTCGLIEPKQSCALTVVLRASRELRLDGATLSANIRGGKAAKVGSAVIVDKWSTPKLTKTSVQIDCMHPPQNPSVR